MCSPTVVDTHTSTDVIPRIISPRQLLERLGISEPTLYRMRARGDLPEPIRLSPGRIGWPEDVIRRWLDGRVERAAMR